MKFLPLRDFDDVTSALNFDTPDCHVVGGCELYTTKAAGTDKKLYKYIEHSLESQYESLLRLSASMSPPTQSSMAVTMNLSRASPFGPLSQSSSRRIFAYLIATLNASHPDYDFSNLLQPANFKREKSLKTVINSIDSTLYNLRPNTSMSLQVPSQTTYATASSATTASQAWGPQMWSLIDSEMTLKDCSIFCFDPVDDPLDDEEQAIWSFNYFFFNKQRKRVAYIYIRGIAVVHHSPRSGMLKRSATDVDRDLGANKRVRYWLGDRADYINNGHVIDDESNEYSFDEDFVDEYDDDDDADDEYDEQSYKGQVRGVSEDIAACMEIE